jgi:nitroimidazol reductase NimA-like FMN-containing flavoprotein (pyridoxamine 5'-phosphate oxidase superfamily)
MRRSEKQVSSTVELEQILWQGKVCHLAIPDLPAPYLVPLNYGYRNRTFYFHSAAEGHKIELLKTNPMVSFSVVIDQGVIESEQACNWGARFRSVVGSGRVEFIEDEAEKEDALLVLMEQYSDREFELPAEAVKATTVFKLIVEQMVGKQSRA